MYLTVSVPPVTVFFLQMSKIPILGLFNNSKEISNLALLIYNTTIIANYKLYTIWSIAI